MATLRPCCTRRSSKVGQDNAPAVGKDGQEQPRRALAVDDDRIWVWGLNAFDQSAKHRSAGAHHTLGRVYDTLNGIFRICRREGHPIVPLHPFMEMEDNRLAAIAHLPALG